MCAVVFFFSLLQLNSESIFGLISEPVVFFLYSLMLLVKKVLLISLSLSLSLPFCRSSGDVFSGGRTETRPPVESGNHG